jgi:hypothetical protein
MAIVEVKPIERDTWHGKRGKDSFKRPVTIEALVNPNTGKYSVAISDKRLKELMDTTGYNLSLNYIQGTPHEFWNTKIGSVKLNDGTTIFDTSRPIDEIKVGILKASYLVANSREDFENGLFPEALFYIYDESERVKTKAKKASVKKKAIIELSKISRARKTEILQILTGTSRRKQSDDYIEVALDDLLEKDGGAEKILNLIARDKARVSIHATILEAIHNNILRKEGTGIYYMDDQIGFDMEAAMDYLLDKKNQAFKAKILEELNS